LIPGKTILILILISFISHAVSAAESLSYSGRLVQTNGSPVTGTVTIRADLSYTNDLAHPICTDDIVGVVLSKGVFHVKLDFACTGGKTLTQVLSQAPVNESVAIQITDVTNSKSYSFQAIHAMPFANVASIASQLAQNGAGDGEFLKWDNATKQWKPGTVSGASGGTVTSVSVGSPLTISTPTSTPTITLPLATGSQSGYLSSADWNSFNNKEGTFVAGTTAQYYRGDKSWRTLDTSAVPENVNLYFTNARALGVPLTGFVTAAGAIAATDTTLQAFGKVQGQINSLTTASANYLIKNSTDSVTGVVNVGTTGLLQLVYVPVGMNDATNKAYVDSETGAKVSKLGDTVTGILTLDSDLKIKGGTNYVTLKGNASTANYNFIFPSSAGSSGQFLQTDGSGNLSWVAQSSTAAPTGSAGGDLAGTYPNPTVPGLANKVSTTLTNGNILIGNGSNVASPVSITGDATLSNAGVLTLANTAVTVGTYTSVTVDGKGRITGGTNPAIVSTVSVTAPVTNSGTATAPVIGMPAATTSANGYLTSADWTIFNNKQDAITSASNINTGSITTNLQNGVILNPNGANTGEIRFKELAGSGVNYTGFKAPGTLGADVIYTLPIADGSSGQVLTTNASGALSWTSIASTAAPIGAAGGDLSGSYPSPTISALNATKVSTGVVDNTEFNYLDGVTSAIQTQLNGKQALDTGLTNFAAFNTNGILVQTANDTYAGRTITGTANRTVITNGDGVLGNPVINVDTGLLPSPASSGQWLKSTAANTSAWTTLGSSDITGALGFTPINKAGDTVSTGTVAFNAIGTLSLGYTPTNLTDATSKSYVDTAVSSGVNQWTHSSGNVYRSTGNVIVGSATSPNAPWDNAGATAYTTSKLALTGNGASGGLSIITDNATINGNAPTISMARSFGSLAAPTAVTGSAYVMTLIGSGHDGTSYVRAAQIHAAIDGTPATGSMPGRLVFSTTPTGAANPVERMRVDSLGRVGIGTSAPGSILHLTHATAPYVTYEEVDTTQKFFTGVDGSNFWIRQGATSNNDIMTIKTTGFVGINTINPSEMLEVSGNVKATAFLYTSDKRLKKNINTLDDALERVLNLRGVSFNWKENDQGEMGFIAQEVEEQEPLLVETSAANGMKSVKYGNIVALLVEAIKEENKVVEENNKKLSTMQNGLKHVEKKVLELSREVSSLKDDNKKLQDENHELKKEIELIKKHLKLK
jgi:hypothetical protein